MSKLIEGWEDLVGLESDNYILDIELNGGCGWIRNKNDSEDWHRYLSTHTFYGSQYKNSTVALQECGFDVQLKNWDGETEEVNYTEQWLYNGHCEFCRRKCYCTQDCKPVKRRREYQRQLKGE